MNIRKIGHCCLVIEENGVRIMTDPGKFTTAQTEEKDIDAVIITHAHADHFDHSSLAKVIKHNPKARIITNSEIIAILADKGIEATLFEEGEVALRGVSIKAHVTAHERIYEGIVLPRNVGYMIANALFVPGDSYAMPFMSATALALPISAPWGTAAGAIDFARASGTKNCFPIHDAILSDEGREVFNRIVGSQLEKHGIGYTPLAAGDNLDIDT